MTDEQVDILCSQLADGELDSDRLNEVLLDVLDDAAGREKLKEHLRLRQSLKAWRQQTPSRPIVAISERLSLASRGGPRWLRWGGGLAAAACLGALLAMAGLWLVGGWPESRIGPLAGSSPAMGAISADDQEHLVQAFRLHESVAGPLKWYAADDRDIRFAASEEIAPVGEPIAVLLRLHPEGGYGKTYALVVRNNQPATIDLPQFGRHRGSTRLHIVPTVTNGRMEIAYTIVIAGSQQSGQSPAILAGQQKVGLASTSLGQMTLDDQLVAVDASAWAFKNHQ